jgi:ferredoxin
MPKVTFHKNGEVFEQEVRPNSNLVVKAGIKQFPYPHLSYKCGMGKCATCACRVLSGAEHLPEPNWKERNQLGDRLEQGYRLVCQLWINQDIELAQDAVTGNAASASPADTKAG